MRRLDARLPHDDTLEVDWSTLDFDVDDPDIARRVHETFGVDRSRQTTVGGRLTSLAEAAGLVPLAETTATQVRPSWDPDEPPRPDGWAPMVVMAASLVEADRRRHDRSCIAVDTLDILAIQPYCGGRATR